MSFDPLNVPDALKAERRWVNWKSVWSERDGKAGRQTKVPNGKSNDPSTWVSFPEAMRRAKYFDGVGFVLGDGWAGLDLDHCRNESGVVTHEAVNFLRRIDCYLEVSPSGEGFKAIGRSARIGGQIDFGVSPAAFTAWSSPRFFAITSRVRGTGAVTQDISLLIEDWFPWMTAHCSTIDVPAYIRRDDTRGTENIDRLTDEQVVARILETPQAEKFVALVRGDLSAYGGDHSRADLALVSILSYWCLGDEAQIDRLFRQSALMRPKWNAASYRRATLTAAARQAVPS